MKVITQQVSSSDKSRTTISSSSPVESHQIVDEIEDTWIFEGKSYKAPEMQIPAPLAAAFKPSSSPLPVGPPYAYDRKKFSVHSVAGIDGSFRVGAILIGGNYIAAITLLDDDFRIELLNSKGGKFPVTKEELLGAVHAAKLDLESSVDVGDVETSLARTSNGK